MTHTNTFDTLQFSKKMVKAGFTQQQAEGQAEALIEIVDNNLATKHDIALIHKDIALIHKDIAGLYKHVNTFGYLICGLIVVSVSLLTILIVHYG